MGFTGDMSDTIAGYRKTIIQTVLSRVLVHCMITEFCKVHRPTTVHCCIGLSETHKFTIYDKIGIIYQHS